MGWYIENIETEEKVFSYSHFRKENVKADILKYLTENPEAELWLYKECFNSRYVGDDFISVFLLRGGQLCKEVYRGDRTFYKRINLDDILIPLNSVGTLFNPKTMNCYPMYTDGTPDLNAPTNLIDDETDAYWESKVSKEDWNKLKQNGLSICEGCNNWNRTGQTKNCHC